jgi:hypothetical protein
MEKRGRVRDKDRRNMTEVKKKGDGIKRMRKEENKGEGRTKKRKKRKENGMVEIKRSEEECMDKRNRKQN